MSFDVRIQRDEPLGVEEWLAAANGHPALRVERGEPVRIDRTDVPLFFTDGVGIHSPDSEDDTIRILLDLAEALDGDVVDDELTRYLADPDVACGYRTEDVEVADEAPEGWPARFGSLSIRAFSQRGDNADEAALEMPDSVWEAFVEAHPELVPVPVEIGEGRRGRVGGRDLDLNWAFGQLDAVDVSAESARVLVEWAASWTGPRDRRSSPAWRCAVVDDRDRFLLHDPSTGYGLSGRWRSVEAMWIAASMAEDEARRRSWHDPPDPRDSPGPSWWQRLFGL